jgi:hypothetical protein
MIEHNNIIPFKRSSSERKVPKPTRPVTPGNNALPGQWNPRPSYRPTVRNPAMPQRDIEMGAQLDTLTFADPDEFVASVSHLVGTPRMSAFTDECALINQKMGWDYRFRIFAGRPGKDDEIEYREHYCVCLKPSGNLRPNMVGRPSGTSADLSLTSTSRATAGNWNVTAVRATR